MSDDIDFTPWENHNGPLPDYDSLLYPVFDSGVTWTIGQLAVVLSVDCNDFSWDAATEEYDGDVRAVIGNAITAALGEEWSALRAELEALRAENARLRQLVVAAANRMNRSALLITRDLDDLRILRDALEAKKAPGDDAEGQ